MIIITIITVVILTKILSLISDDNSDKWHRK
jgi:hypothetical protein